MPKRAATPPIDDGAKYLTVVHPFPSRPNMEFHAHRKLFAQWVAACIGPHHLRVFYYKPTSPGSIILEIDGSMPDFGKILGAHKWSAFLADPGSEGHHVSKVFYCTYNSDRIVQKNGWKRVDVKDDWVARPSAKFVSPYPETYWCDIPKIGNVIQNDLCRPLPNANFPPPPPPEPAPVVGTLEWQEWKRRQDALRPARGWVRGTPRESLNGTSAPNSSPVTRAQSGQSTPTVQPIPRQAWRMATNGLLSPSGLPPGIMRAQSSASSTSSNSSNSSSGGHKNAWSRAPSTRSLSPLEAPSGSSTSSSDGPLTPTTSEPIGRIVLVKDNVEDALAALTLDGDEDFGEDDVYFSVADDASVTGDPQSDSLWDAPPADYAVSNGVKVEESLWGDYEPQDDPESDEDDDRALVKAAEKEPELCRIHNVVCKKGICKVYAAQLRDQKRREREEERKKEREAALARRNKKTDKKGSFFKDAPSSNGGSTPATARAPPAHLRLGAAAPASAGVPRSLPGHLRRGASSDPASGRTTPTPAQPQDIDVDDARSETSSGVWDAASAGPWGPSGGARAPPSNTGATINTNGASAPKAWGTWGRAPSVSASSVLRNNDSWSVSARSAGGPGATGDGTNGEDNQDAQSVSGRSATGWGTGSDGPWGSSEAVRQAGKGKGARSKTKAKTQDEVDEFDVRSVAGSSASWGNVSAGIW